MFNENEALNSLVRSDFYSYFQKVYYEVGGENFISNWHLEYLADVLEKCRRREIKRLIINVPPRSGKSIITNIAFPTWLLANNPKESIICTSYSQELSEKFARDCKNVMSSEWYRGAFPRTQISKERSSAYDFNTTKRGGRFSTSVEGTLTGRGGDFIIIDDPIKPDDAFSEVKLDKVIEWYKNTLLSRLDDKENGVIIVIMQRVHQNDLTGYLLENSSNDWMHVRMPAIAEEDEVWEFSNGRKVRRVKGNVLSKNRESLEVLQSYKNAMGEFTFSGQYQQSPMPVGGGLVKKKWLQYYGESELPKFNEIIISWDTASKKGSNNAYSACTIWGVVGKGSKRKYYLLEVFRDRLEIPQLLKKVKEIYDHYKDIYRGDCSVRVLIEDMSSGTYIIQEIKNNWDLYKFKAEAVIPDADKESRLKGASIKIERGDVYFPLKEWSWWNDFEKELLTFPASKFKDQVDSLSQALNAKEKLGVQFYCL